MQEEVNEKVIAVSIGTGKLTAEILQKALKCVLTQAKEQGSNFTHPKGKQSLKQLMNQNTGVSSIEITDENIRAFEKTAKKYGIDFALKRVVNEGKARFLVFFKGRDADVLTAAFNEFTQKKLLSQNKPSIRNTLHQLKSEVTPHVLPPNHQRTKQQVKEVQI